MRSKLSFIAFVSIVFISLSCVAPKGVTTGEWVKLGSRKVNYNLDRDVIPVTAKKGGFKKLKLVVREGALNMRKMVVQYGNGTKDNIPIRFHFRKGATARVIDLKGGKRIIKKINFWYDTKNRPGGRATINVWGKR